MQSTGSSFNIRLGKDDWLVELTDDKSILGKNDSAFGFGYIYIRKTLSLKKRNVVLLEELTKGAVFETGFFDYMKSLLDDKFLTCVKELSTVLGQILVQKNISSDLRQQARKERYRRKIERGHIPKKQLPLKIFEGNVA